MRLRRRTRRHRLARCSTRRVRLCRIARAVPTGRATKCFVVGIRPAATCGAEVTGVSPAPFRNIWQLAAHTFRPKARGRSLTAVSLIHHDPAGRASYAASSCWTLESWRAVAHDPDALSTPSLTSAYYCTRAEVLSATWRTARGPVAVACLEL